MSTILAANEAHPSKSNLVDPVENRQGAPSQDEERVQALSPGGLWVRCDGEKKNALWAWQAQIKNPRTYIPLWAVERISDFSNNTILASCTWPKGPSAI